MANGMMSGSSVVRVARGTRSDGSVIRAVLVIKTILVRRYKNAVNQILKVALGMKILRLVVTDY